MELSDGLNETLGAFDTDGLELGAELVLGADLVLGEEEGADGSTTAKFQTRNFGIPCL